MYEYLKERYGEWILFDPEFNKNTYFLWLMPIFMFLIGGLLIFKLFIIRKN
ncbi:MAG: cytochrome c-type biogenesis protein CcmH [Gammaproteobacteria bacterium]